MAERGGRWWERAYERQVKKAEEGFAAQDPRELRHLAILFVVSLPVAMVAALLALAATVRWDLPPLVVPLVIVVVVVIVAGVGRLLLRRRDRRR